MKQRVAGYLVRLVCDSLPDGEREQLIDKLWSCNPVAIEERDGEIVAGFADEGSALVAMALFDGATELTAVTDDSYLGEYRRYLQRTSIGSISIRPPWLGAVGDGIDVVVDPGRAFGTGSHATTALAVELLCATELAGLTVVDLGSGSGVLSIVAAKLGAGRVYAVDTDAEARLSTQLNAARNGLQSAVEIDSSLRADVPFDVVVANVLLPVHRELAAKLSAARVVIASGVLESQRELLVSHYPLHSIAIERTRDGWFAARLVR